MTLKAIPITLRAANEFVGTYHRHNGTSRGCKFAIGARLGKELVGVVIAGRPLSRLLDNGLTLEVLRLCTDGTRNACSFLYARAIRVAQLMGYRLVITYTRRDEDGASLRSVAARPVAITPGRQWSCPSRTRALATEMPDRIRWVLWEESA